MADPVVEFALKEIDAFLTREIGLPDRISSSVKNLKHELDMMKAFLKTADNGGEQKDPQILSRVGEVREIAHDIEDAFDMNALDIAKQQIFFRSRRVGKWIGDHSMAKFIDKIEESLRNIKDRKERYPIFHNSSSSQASSSSMRLVVNHDHPRITYLGLKDYEIVGMEDDKCTMISWALDERDPYNVKFVTGMGGSGKTTLVKQVFDGVKEDFDCHAWIAVSKNEKVTILHKLLDQLCSRNSTAESISQQRHRPNLDEHELISHLRDVLQCKKYVIVLDDLWSNDVWKCIWPALPRANSSRVIITTRRGDIAFSCREKFISVHQLQPLPPEEAQQLFHRKAFPASGSCPPQLVDWSSAILRKCEGLPLAITEIGRILSAGEERGSEWQKIHDSIVSNLSTNGCLQNITTVMMLSYYDLPCHLKYCFLFMNMFPCDSPIISRQLIRLWVAEGFVEKKQGKELEDVGEEYLKELIQRSLVQVSEEDFDGRAKTCHVHNMMHYIVLSKLQDEGFCAVSSQEHNGTIMEKTRRVSVQINEFRMPSSCPDFKARALLMFRQVSVAPPCPMPAVNFTRFKLLKELHLQGFGLDKFPEEIKELLLLRYLCLRNTNINCVPSFIGKLRHLETLDLKQTKVTKLPKEIKYLVELRHLFVYRSDIGLYSGIDNVTGFEVSSDITTLTNLQKLSFVTANNHIHPLEFIFRSPNDTIEMLRKLKKLRKLGIINLSKKDGKSLCETIQELQQLYSLSLASMDIHEVLDIDQEISPPPQLQRLHLNGKLERMPGWILKLNDLARLRLNWSQLPISDNNPIEILEDLPNLLVLELLDAYKGSHLDFKAGKFKKLKVLVFERLERLKMVIMEETTLPFLEKLTIKKCQRLEMVPIGIDKLTCLKELNLYGMPEEFVSQVERMHDVVRHIPLIRAHYFNGQEWFFEDLQSNN